MKVGDLVRVLMPWTHHEPFLLQITEVFEDSVNVIVMNGPYIGIEHQLPFDGRQWEVVDAAR